MESKHVCWNCGCNPAKERRERIATAVLAGIAGNSDLRTLEDYDLAWIALEQADALIAALDAPQETKLYEDGER